jgi:hypothetical protein
MHQQTAASSIGRNSGFLFDELKIDGLPTRSIHHGSITPARKADFEASKVSVETRPGLSGTSRQTTNDPLKFGQGDVEARRATSPRSSLISPYLAYTSASASKDPPLRSTVTEELSAENAEAITPSLEDLRAARLRRFHSSNAAQPDFELLQKSAKESVQSTRQSRATFSVPAGTDCIDLTND